VQLRDQTKLTSKDYVTQEAWKKATLDRCPAHPRGGCGFHRNGTYGRVNPPGMRIARYYCLTARSTYSLLPDFLASRFSGELATVEGDLAKAEQHTTGATGHRPSVEAAANAVRTDDITLPSAVRWLRRRLMPVRMALIALVTMMPELFAGCAPTVTAMRLVLGTGSALVELREVGAVHLGALPPPLGFGPRRKGGWRRWGSRQHEAGPDPPA
jgi:hypothetical protein